MSQGWILLHRQIQDSWIWKDKPFSKGQAWVDLLLLANHKERKILLSGELKVIQRGQFHTSLRKLADRWGWDFKTVKKFLDLLETDGMITQECNTKGNTITLVNYGVYQDSVVHASEHSMEHGTEHDGYTGWIQTNNVKNKKNVNKIPQYKKFSHSDEDSVLEQELLSN